MAHNVSRLVTITIQLRADNSSQVSNGDLKTVGSSTFRLSAHVHGWPAESQRDRRVDTSGSEEDTGVAYSRTCYRIGVAKKDAVANDGGERGSDDEGRTDLASLGNDRICNSKNGGEGIRGDCQELSFPVLVSEGGNNTRLIAC